jgi:putative transposase
MAVSCVRGKGVKRNLVVEVMGGPLGVTIAGANVHDTKLLAASLQTIVVVRPLPTDEQSQHLYCEEGYANPTGHETVATSRDIPHIRRIGERTRHANGEKR